MFFIITGAPGVGRNELKQRLISYDPVHYKTTIPRMYISLMFLCISFFVSRLVIYILIISLMLDTSRSPKSWEEEGKEYYFASREVMEEGIRDGKFVEYGEYRGNLYGTSLDSVFTIVRSGRVCILNPHPQVSFSLFLN